MPFSLGVDIGSTYTAAALWRDGTVHTAPLGNRSNAVPSIVFLRADGALLIGEAARRRAVTEPGRQARDFKRRMGDDVPVLLDGHRFAVPELTGHLLRWVVDTVAEREGERPGHVVLTHPVQWGEYRTRLLVGAAATAGLDGVGLLPEPVAAASWYAAQERIAPGALIGVYDLGGGTFDASVVRKTETGFEVAGEPGGDDTVGGVDFDHALLRHVAVAAAVDLASFDDTDPAVASALELLLDTVVEAKEALSADREAVVPVLLPGVTRHVTVTRAAFEDLIRSRVLDTVGLFAQVAARAGADAAGPLTVLLVGGSSRIPLVAELLRSELGARVALDAHPKYAVCLGAAITAATRVAPGIGGGRPAAATTDPDRWGPAAAPLPPGARTGPTSPFGRTGPVPPGAVPGPVRPDAPAGPLPTPGEVAASPPPGADEIAVTRPVDLAGTGLTAPGDVTVRIPERPAVARPIVTDRDEPVVIRTRDAGSGGRGRRTAMIAATVIALVVAAVVIVTLRGRTPAQPATGGRTPGPAPTSAGGSAGGVATLGGQLVTEPPGVDAMRGVAALGDDLIAVGVSVDLRPRAWTRHGDGRWQVVAVPGGGTGTVADVAAGPGRSGPLVAVGWVRSGRDVRHAAVWTSTTGRDWRPADASPDLTADGISELTAVVAVPGGFLATGVDRRTDTVDGDVAVFRSADGRRWRRATASGLDGPGPQEVHRVIRTGAGRLVAVGAALAGAHRGPAVWTSADGSRWEPATSAPAGSATLWTVAEQPGGALLACGATGSVDAPAAACWLQPRDGVPWRPVQVTAEPGAPAALYVYDLAGPVAVGAGRAGATVDASAWLLRLSAS